MTKSDLTLPAFSLTFCTEILQFNSAFAVRFQFHSTKSDCWIFAQINQQRLTVAWFFWINRNPLLRIATNEIASFCIDIRLGQMTFSVFTKVGKDRFSSYIERFWNKKASCFFMCLLYETNKFHVAVRLFSKRSQMTSKCGKNNKSGTWGDSRVRHTYSYHILTPTC